MKRVVILIGSLFLLLLLVYFSLPFFVFKSYEIYGVDEPYHTMVEKLNDLRTQNRLPLEEMKGGEKYSFKFQKGMDHTCVIRVDGAALAITNIEQKYKISDNPFIDGLTSLNIPWYYNDERPGLKQYVIDQYNYYVVDPSQKIVWYVGFSV